MARMRPPESATRPRRVDHGFIVGLVLAAGALLTGLSLTQVQFAYFLNPVAAVIVLGGTLGVLVITTPIPSLLQALRRMMDLASAPELSREQLGEEIVNYAKTVRQGGLLAIEPEIQDTRSSFLRDALLLALDVRTRAELEAALETELRLIERQGETDAKVLEVAGGFVPAIGIIGTVIGLIDVMRHFSDLPSVGFGIGTAFVSTIYGLVLANLVLLPIAHRIRSRVAATFEIQELIIEGVLCLYDQTHPTLVRLRLAAFLRSPKSSLQRYDVQVPDQPLESRPLEESK
jgi:chemotaxis protein MotA